MRTDFTEISLYNVFMLIQEQDVYIFVERRNELRLLRSSVILMLLLTSLRTYQVHSVD